MKRALVSLLLFVSPAFAQNPQIAPACGSDDVKYDVSTKKVATPAAQPPQGKALVYFIEDDNDFASIPKPTTRFGLNGQWLGATHCNSYFSVAVDPGEHHVCANWQHSVIILTGAKTAAAHFTAEPGQTYFFRVRNKWTDHTKASMHLDPIDNDEGAILIAQYRVSDSRPKK